MVDLGLLAQHLAPADLHSLARTCWSFYSDAFGCRLESNQARVRLEAVEHMPKLLHKRHGSLLLMQHAPLLLKLGLEETDEWTRGPALRAVSWLEPAWLATHSVEIASVLKKAQARWLERCIRREEEW